MTGLVLQLCDTFTESRISATQHGPARLPILLKQTRVAPDSYSRNLGLFNGARNVERDERMAFRYVSLIFSGVNSSY